MAFVSKISRENKSGFYNVKPLPSATNIQASDECYIETVKTSKKAHINRENIFQLMLMQIPGISSVSASALANEFKNIETLLQSLKHENAKTFENIKLASGRKLNKNILETLREFLI
jgi:hypothetical protein